MATMDDAQRLATALPSVTEGIRYGHRTWLAGGTVFAWERPFSKADVKRFGAQPVPSGPILALGTGDLEEKAAILAAGHDGVFTIPHFDTYPALLVQLDRVVPSVLAELVVDAWLAAAPADDAAEYLKSHPL